MVFPKESSCHVYSLKSPKTGLSRPSSLLFQMTTPIIHEALSEQQLRWLNTVLRAVSGNARDRACF